MDSCNVLQHVAAVLELEFANWLKDPDNVFPLMPEHRSLSQVDSFTVLRHVSDGFLRHEVN